MELVTDTMASLGDIFSSLGSVLGDSVDGVVTLLTPDSVYNIYIWGQTFTYFLTRRAAIIKGSSSDEK